MSKFWSTRQSSSSSSSDNDDESVNWSQDSEDDNNTTDTEEQKDQNEKTEITDDNDDNDNSNNDNTGNDPSDQIQAWDRLKTSQTFADIPTISASNARKDSHCSTCTRIVCMSDTHGQHRMVTPPKGQVLIHGGDWTQSGEPGTIQDLAAYFGQLAFPQTIAIAGNHDVTFHPEHYDQAWQRYHNAPFECDKTQAMLTNCTYLQDDSCWLYPSTTTTTVPAATAANTKTTEGPEPTGKEGSSLVYGSPWQPFFYHWAFNLQRGWPLRSVWSSIPTETDVLITHGPPLGRRDTCGHGVPVGCLDLLEEVQQRIQPRLHIFGHIHEDHGTSYDGTTFYVNASNINRTGLAIQHCVVIDLPHDLTQPARVVQPECQIHTVRQLQDWFRENGFENLAKAVPVTEVEDATVHRLPLGDELLEQSAFQGLMDGLGAMRDRSMRQDIVKALSMIHAESY